MSPYEALYGKQCRTPLCWNETGERKLLGPEIVQTTVDKVNIIRIAGKRAGPAHSGCGPKWVGPVWPEKIWASF